MSEITGVEALDRWNDVMKRVASLAKELGNFDSSDSGKSLWSFNAKMFDEMRRKGNIMAQQKSLSRQETEIALKDWSDKAEKKANPKSLKKKKLILDG